MRAGLPDLADGKVEGAVMVEPDISSRLLKEAAEVCWDVAKVEGDISLRFFVEGF